MVARACSKVRGFMAAHAITVYYVTLAVYITAIGALAYNAQQNNLMRINDNRVEQTRQSCRERNEERTILRENFRTQRQQTRKVPAAAFAQFGVSKQEALARLDGAIREFHRLDCGERVRAVRDALD